jgi:UDP-GlcNAc:undecaprenyl-phosphate GlcNAc-1-phosphate transferase
METLLSTIPIAILFFFMSFVSIYLIADSGLTRFFVDIPDKRKLHGVNIPRIGGFCIIIGFFLVIFILLIFQSTIFSFWLNDSVGKSIILSAIIVFIIGFFDDTTLFTVNAYQKIAIQFSLAAAIVLIFGLYISEFNFLGRIYNLGIFGFVLTIIWIVGVMNAFNIIDGIDGLMGSLVLVSLVFATGLFLFAGGNNQDYIIITIPMIAMVLAFLRYNYSPAVIFAGDSGSLFFGAVVAILSVKIGTIVNTGVKIETFSVFYIVAIPVIEVLVSMIRRYAYGSRDEKSTREKIKMMMMPDNRHMHHRLVNKGYSHERVLFFLLSLSFLFALCSIIINISSNHIIKIFVFLYSIYVIICTLNYLDYGKKRLRNKTKNLAVEKYIFVFCDNNYFEKSLYSAIAGNYCVEKFTIIYEESKKKNIESFIIYNDDENFIERDIGQIYEIRKLFNSAIFFISSTENLIKYSHILKNEKNVYFVEKPVDITMLIHNIDKISYSGEIHDGVYLETNSEKGSFVERRSSV